MAGAEASVDVHAAADAVASADVHAAPEAEAAAEAPIDAAGPVEAADAIVEPSAPAIPDPEPPLPADFDDFNLDPALKGSVLQMGWIRPTPVQVRAFRPLVDGHDVMVQSHTGSGKTGAFCIPWLAARYEPKPAAETGVQLLVLLPTRELAKQVCDELGRLATHAPVELLPVYGGTAMQPQFSALRAGVHAVVGTPGRILDHIRRRSLDLSRVRTVILDECDEMLSMGFLEDIRAILDACTGPHQTCLFSATVPPDVQRIARRYMKEPVMITLSGDSVAAAEIEHAYYMVSGTLRTRDLVDVVVAENPARAIVFCNTREETKLVANVLTREGYDAEALSSDLTQVQREKVMKAMREHRIRFLVATDVAARGIDISHVTHVINFSFPEQAENYVHRTGRTGRAGRRGLAISLIGPRDIGNFYYLKLQYPSIKMHERHLPPPEQLAAERLELKLDSISRQFPEQVSPEWVLLARGLMGDPRGERVIALLLERAMRAVAPRPPLLGDDDEAPIGAEEAAPVSAEAPREAERDREHERPRDRERRDGDRERRDGDRERRDGDRERRDDRDRRDGRDGDRDRRPDRGRRGRDRDRDRDRRDGRDGDRDRRGRGERPERGRRRHEEPSQAAPATPEGETAEVTAAPEGLAMPAETPIAVDAIEPSTDFLHAPSEADADLEGPDGSDGPDGPDGSESEADGDEAPEGEANADAAGDPNKRRRRRRRRGKRRREDGEAVEALDAGTEAAEDAPPSGAEIDGEADGETDEVDALATDPATAGEAGSGDRRRRRRRRRGAGGARPAPAPAAVVAPAPPIPRVSQDEIIIDIDEEELDVVRDHFGEVDELDELTVKGRRRAVIDALHEEMEIEDLSDRDAHDQASAPAEPTPAVSAADDASPASDDSGAFRTIDGASEAVHDAAGALEVGDAEEVAAAEVSESESIEAESESESIEAESEAAESEADDEADEGGDAPRKRRRRRRRRKAAPIEMPDLTAPPHKDFWEVWAARYTFEDFEDHRFQPRRAPRRTSRRSPRRPPLRRPGPPSPRPPRRPRTHLSPRTVSRPTPASRSSTTTRSSRSASTSVAPRARRRPTSAASSASASASRVGRSVTSPSATRAPSCGSPRARSSGSPPPSPAW
ncbi:MAG: DEAD/DEAH box helicase [Nannocystaceae bacterium]